MRFFRDLKTMQKIMGLILLMTLFLVGIGYLGYHYLSKANTAMASMYNERLLPIKWLNGIRTHNRANEGNVLKLILTKDVSVQQEIIKDIEKRAADANKLIAGYEQTRLQTYEKEQLILLKQELATHRAERTHIISLVNSGKNQEAWLYFEETQGTISRLNKVLRDLTDYNDQVASKVYQQNSQESAWAEKMILAIILLAVVLSSTLGWLLARLIAKPLRSIVTNVQEVAKGNLAIQQVQVNAQDEVGELAVAFNTMTINLSSLVKQVIQSAQQVAAASQELIAEVEEVSQASTQISQSLQGIATGAEDSRQQVDNISATTLEMSAGIEQVAANTQSVAGNAQQANSFAEFGKDELTNATKQMYSIGSTVESLAQAVKLLGGRSREIGNIVEVITGIAGQTNLLALNAAIEAARAGEQGRGFAVVADEVRKLAEQSGQAAEQIACLIREIQKETEQVVFSMEKGNQEVQTGIEGVDRVGTSFQKILQAIQELSNQVEDISAAMQQMAAGTDTLVGAINEIGQDAKKTQQSTEEIASSAQQQNASLEEIASSGNMLATMAEELQLAVARFKI